MKVVRRFLLASFVWFAAAPAASAMPVAIGEFGFNFTTGFPDFDFFQVFTVSNNLAPDDPLAGLLWSATVVVTRDSGSESLEQLGPVGPGEAAITSVGPYLGSVEYAALNFGTLVGFSAGILTLPAFDPVADPFALSVEAVESVTIFYDPEIASVPEPGTLLLVGSGLAFVAMRGRRRRS